MPTDTVAASKSTLLSGLVPGLDLLPTEDAQDFDALRQGLFEELVPGTPYERCVVESILALEWDMQRHRRLRDNLLKSRFRTLLQRVLETGNPQSTLFSLHENFSEEVEEAAHGFLAGDPELRRQVDEALAEGHVDVQELLALAYSSISGRIEVHERAIADLERRRRLLRDEFDKLKQARLRPIPDAEVVEG